MSQPQADHLPPSPAQQMQVPIVNQWWDPPPRPPYRPDTSFVSGVPLPLMVEAERRRNSQAQYQEILSRIASLEETMGEIREALRAPGIGHNRPHPFDDSDSQAIELAVADLLSQREAPAVSRAIQAATTLTTIAEKIRLYSAEQGDHLGLWSIFADKLFALGKAASDWIVSLGGSPF